MAFGLRQQHRLFAGKIDACGIHQHDGGICGRGAGNHIARILFVTGRIRDDEFTFRRGEITVSHINGNTLLSLGGQAVGKAGEIGILTFRRRLVELGDLIGQQGFAIVQQTAD